MNFDAILQLNVPELIRIAKKADPEGFATYLNLLDSQTRLPKWLNFFDHNEAKKEIAQTFNALIESGVDLERTIQWEGMEIPVWGILFVRDGGLLKEEDLLAVMQIVSEESIKGICQSTTFLKKVVLNEWEKAAQKLSQTINPIDATTTKKLCDDICREIHYRGRHFDLTSEKSAIRSLKTLKSLNQEFDASKHVYEILSVEIASKRRVGSKDENEYSIKLIDCGFDQLESEEKKRLLTESFQMKNPLVAKSIAEKMGFPLSKKESFEKIVPLISQTNNDFFLKKLLKLDPAKKVFESEFGRIHGLRAIAEAANPKLVPVLYEGCCKDGTPLFATSAPKDLQDYFSSIMPELFDIVLENGFNLFEPKGKASDFLFEISKRLLPGVGLYEKEEDFQRACEDHPEKMRGMFKLLTCKPDGEVREDLAEVYWWENGLSRSWLRRWDDLLDKGIISSDEAAELIKAVGVDGIISHKRMAFGVKECIKIIKNTWGKIRDSSWEKLPYVTFGKIIDEREKNGLALHIDYSDEVTELRELSNDIQKTYILKGAGIVESGDSPRKPRNKI